jgi:hypothetical protein
MDCWRARKSNGAVSLITKKELFVPRSNSDSQKTNLECVTNPKMEGVHPRFSPEAHGQQTAGHDCMLRRNIASLLSK